MKINDRDTLIDLKKSAMNVADSVSSPFWIDAFKELAMAADRCDAIIARATNAESAAQTVQQEKQ